MAMVTPAELRAAGVEVTRKPTIVIETFDTDWQKEWFTYKADHWPRRTHKVNDPLIAAPKGAKLSLQVRSVEANKLVVGVGEHAAEAQLDGGEAWQTITLSPSDFFDARGEALMSWEGIRELRLADEETLRARRPDATRKVGARWKGTDPAFRELKWVTEGTAFTHPGISHSQASIDLIKAKIAAGEQPWARAWEKVQESRYASLDWRPQPHPHVERGPSNNPNIGSSDFTSDANASYIHALHWTLTGKVAHAKKAAEIINAWSQKIESISNHDARLLVGMDGYDFCNAAELLRHTWDGWPQRDQAQFESMLRNVFYPVIKNYYPTANGNWDASMLQTMLAMGVFLDDRAMFDRGIDYYLNGAGNGAVRNYFKPSGQCQETGRDQGHTQMGLDYLACTCEIAWNQGIDLYSAFENRLLKGFEYTAKYNLGQEVPYEPYRSYQGRYYYKSISDKARGGLRPMYEKVLNHYQNRKGLKAKFTGEAAMKLREGSKERRSRRRRSSAVDTLMFSGQFDRPPALMPKAEDSTSMWWKEGFPSVVKNAPWRRVIQTGRYAFVLDTETLTLPHFGAIGNGMAWSELPSAELALTIHSGGKIYHCTGAKPWTRETGPRLIESGRFFQRSDITDLIFKSEEGEEFSIKTRLEAAAWPDRLGFVLVSEPPIADAKMEITLTAGGKTLRSEASAGKAGLAIDPVEFRKIGDTSSVVVKVGKRPVAYEPSLGWHRINLDGILPDRADTNDAMERIPFTLSNPTDREQVARLMFEKTRRGIRQRIGQPITGMSAVLRDAEGEPTGIPVQLSKTWHTQAEGRPYAEQWFHGITQVRLQPGEEVALELVIVYGHWGGVAAASHAQLSLIGWGGNQLWEESALGSWGESICYDPPQAQADCSITDVRPLMVTSMSRDAKWGWTNNVGGGDFFRLFDAHRKRLPHSAMTSTHHRNGPCLTEVTYSGNIGDGIRHSVTASLARTGDIIRGTYRIRLDVDQLQPFSRFAIFQVGADTYNFTREPKFAVGNASGLIKEWSTTPGGDTYRTPPMRAIGDASWISMHEAKRRPGSKEGGAWANRGIVIREWSARLGGKQAPAHFSERGTVRHRSEFSTIDLVPPPGLTRLEPGDFIEATIEYLVFPQNVADYYGPDEALRSALQKDGNTWHMVHREAIGNRRAVKVGVGQLIHRFPDIRIHTASDKASFEVTGGVGHVPITITGLRSHAGYSLTINGKQVDQSVHGKDFWQTDYDPDSTSWNRTYNVLLPGNEAHRIELSKVQ